MAIATSAFVILPILRILGGGYIGNKNCPHRGPVVSRSTVRSGSVLEGGEVGDAAIVPFLERRMRGRSLAFQ